MSEPSFQLWFAVRYVHVAAVALLAGGATMLAAWCLVPRAAAGADAALVAAPIYEWTFWLLVGLVAVTGVSNLGLKGEGLMSPATSWGRALTTKLAVLLTLLAVSLLRSDFVIRCGAASVSSCRIAPVSSQGGSTRQPLPFCSPRCGSGWGWRMGDIEDRAGTRSVPTWRCLPDPGVLRRSIQSSFVATVVARLTRHGSLKDGSRLSTRRTGVAVFPRALDS